MQYVNLGRSGLKVSRLALGMMTWGSSAWRPWVRSEAEAVPIVRRALDLGINVFDTADVYSAGVSEELTGRILSQYAPRDEIVVATKLYLPVDLAFKGQNATGPKPVERPNGLKSRGLSRKRLMTAVDASLQRLKLDHIDLYQIHRFDPATPVEETMEALHDVVKAGKVRYIGASSMWAWQFAQLQFVAERHGWTRFVSMQNHYNLAYREEEREMNPFCRATGVGLMPWSPLARGFLAGNRRKDDAQRAASGETSRAATDDIAQSYYYRDADYAVLEALTKLAQARGLSNATVAYAWLLHQAGVSCPIVGVSKVEQLEQAVAAVDLALSDEELKALGVAYQPHAVLGHT
jgi:aryl-alcohol dehydrogenase-like predicted oxidoreductase